MTMKRLGRHAAAWLAWVGVLWAFWILLVGEWSQIEVIAASCVAPLAATVAELVRARAGLRARVPLRLVWAGRTVPLMVFVDFAVITWALLVTAAHGRRVHGTFRAKPFAAGGEDAAGLGRRAFTTVAATYSPNAYVIDIDRERDVVLVHDIVPLSASESPA